MRILSELTGVARNMGARYGKHSQLFCQGRTIVKEQWLACLMTGVVYVASWLPYGYVCTSMFFGGVVTEITECVVIFLSKSSTISSPIVYCMVETKFRNYVKEQFTTGKNVASPTATNELVTNYSPTNELVTNYSPTNEVVSNYSVNQSSSLLLKSGRRIEMKSYMV